MDKRSKLLSVLALCLPLVMVGCQSLTGLIDRAQGKQNQTPVPVETDIPLEISIDYQGQPVDAVVDISDLRNNRQLASHLWVSNGHAEIAIRDIPFEAPSRDLNFKLWRVGEANFEVGAWNCGYSTGCKEVGGKLICTITVIYLELDKTAIPQTN